MEKIEKGKNIKEIQIKKGLSPPNIEHFKDKVCAKQKKKWKVKTIGNCVQWEKNRKP